jgi:hypothetical protein
VTKIIAMEAENVMRLKAVYIEPSGSMVEITGENEQGKSSLMEAIWMALGGKDAIPKDPIRKGEQKAKVRLDMGEFEVTRTFTRREDGEIGTTVTVTAGEGFTRNKPQEFLTKIVGALTFDPLAFATKKPKEQFDMLRGFVKDYDFEAEAEKRKTAFVRRTAVNAAAANAKARAEAIVIPPDAPAAEVDETALLNELDEAGRFNASLGERKQKRENARFRLTGYDEDIARMNSEIEELERRLADRKAKLVEITEERIKLSKALDAAAELPEPIDTIEIRQKIDAARGINDRYRAAQRAKTMLADLQQEQAESEKRAAELTKVIEVIDEQKAKAIASAELPVKGLGFADDYVTLDGVPFEQASKAQRIRAGIAIAAALNPTLRVARVMDGSLLDHKSWAILEEFARENNLQVWIETVESDRPGAIVIEDGSVRAIINEDGAEVPPVAAPKKAAKK